MVSVLEIFLWHHGPIPHQNMQVTYRATNELRYTKMTLSPSHYTKYGVSGDSFEA